MSAPLPETARSRPPQRRTCRVSGCEEEARLRGFCPPCWGHYLRARRRAEAQLELRALALRGEVEEGLIGAPALWESMAINLAAWRTLPLDDDAGELPAELDVALAGHGRRRSDWWRALVDTIAEVAGL